MKTSGSVIVSWDFSSEIDDGILIVGEQKNGTMDILNAFQGPEATELYRRLTTKKVSVEKQQSSSVGKG